MISLHLWKRRVLAVALIALGIFTTATLSVGWYAVQEDVYLSRWSPLVWVLVDPRLRSLDLGPDLPKRNYYCTVGDGPKLPGSDVTFFGPVASDVALERARTQLIEKDYVEVRRHPTEAHFEEADGAIATVHVIPSEGGCFVRVFVSLPLNGR